MQTGHNDPEFKGRVELTQGEAVQRKSCVGTLKYTLVISLKKGTLSHDS
jgi:hypothetical protein